MEMIKRRNAIQRMEKIKEHFEKEAKEFDDIIIKLIPHYNQMIDALVTSIHFDTNSKIRVIDLGCGTGTVANMISKRFMNSNIICLDIASKYDRYCKTQTF